jgi:hypothetical protein
MFEFACSAKKYPRAPKTKPFMARAAANAVSLEDMVFIHGPKQVVVIDLGFVRWRNPERDFAGAHAIFGESPAIPGE